MALAWLGTAGVFLVIRSRGEMLVAPLAIGAGTLPAATVAPDVLRHVLIALAAVIVTGHVLGRMFARIGQPRVIGEVVAGILLGPSLLGPDASALILPPSIAPYLGAIAQLGVILYMFLVGLELDVGLLRQRAHATVAISHASILVPFLLGGLLALFLYPRLASSDVTFTSFALFMGVGMSITAFPVLARILTDRGMTRTEIGAVALSCAAVDDVTAWCLLALVVGVVRARIDAAFLVVTGAVLYIAFMVTCARPMLRRVVARWETGHPAPDAVPLVFVAALLSATATEAIGIHALFGAFLLGAVLPGNSALMQALVRNLQPVVVALFLPAFFAFTGMRTRIDLLSGATEWTMCGVIILTATLGKFGGTVVAARLGGLGWHDASVLGTLMNTRGLMELIVLNVGLDLGVISPRLFAMMVLMALLTTMATSPVLAALERRAELRGLETPSLRA